LGKVGEVDRNAHGKWYEEIAESEELGSEGEEQGLERSSSQESETAARERSS
jgi:hypothetical protein